MTQVLQRCEILGEMLRSNTAVSADGERVAIHSNISDESAEALYRAVRRADPAVVVEVGMAFGTASLAILSALSDGTRDGRLVTIDPNQSSQWKGCGRAAVERAGFADRHELIEEFDYKALPRLLERGLEIDFAYIDGWHTFDYALLDWWYIDKMLGVGGVVGFNDCDWPALVKVIRFVNSHRKYEEIDVGLRPTYTRRHDLLRRATLGLVKRWYPRGEDRYFKKTADWEPTWNFFSKF